ncbi:serine hydrolase domain-containing protein [Kordia sp.]|uniref:serine hydrolase domain-containing protein n=1 Tax=Kordia sp. TaxID=1965332 RepID=UPI003D2B33BC
MKINLIPLLLFFSMGLYAQMTNQIDKKVNDFMQKWEIPGVSVAIAYKGQLVYANGYGYSNKAKKEKVLPKHRFRIGSISKSLTAITIFKLIEEGKLNLTDKVFGASGILNDTIYSKIIDDRVLEINVGQLLEHTAGWDSHKKYDPMFKNQLISDSLKLDRSPEPKDVIRYMLKTQYLDYSPGTIYSYSNLGYCILGRVIEKLTGLTYENAVKEKILIPLKMFDTKIGGSKKSGENESMYHSDYGFVNNSAFHPFKEKVKPEYGAFDLSLLDSCGGWISNSIDLAKLMCAIDSYPNRKDILSPDSINSMLSTSIENSDYAKGWFVNNDKDFWHNGSLIGSYSMVANINDGRVWVILINDNEWTNQKFYKNVDKLLFKATAKLDFSKLQDIFKQYD